MGNEKGELRRPWTGCVMKGGGGEEGAMYGERGRVFSHSSLLGC